MMDRILHFLKEMPDKYLLIFVFLIMFSVGVFTSAIEPRDLSQMIRDALIALLAIFGYRRLAEPPKTEVKTDTLNAEVTAENLSIENETANSELKKEENK